MGLRYQQMTPVPRTSDTVRGLINLRGEIVTAIEVRRQLIYIRSRPAGSDDVVVIFDRVDETPENFVVQSPLKLGGVSKRWFMNVATTPRRNGQPLRPGIRTFETEGVADTYTLPAGGLWPGEENLEAQCHVQTLLPRKRTVRWVGGVDPDLDLPSTNLVPGLYRIKLTDAGELDGLMDEEAYKAYVEDLH